MGLLNIITQFSVYVKLYLCYLWKTAIVVSSYLLPLWYSAAPGTLTGLDNLRVYTYPVLCMAIYNRKVNKEETVPEEVIYHAGFPNAAADAARMGLSLDKLVVSHPVSTYFWHLAEDMLQPGWLAGDIVVVDRSLQPKPGDWVVAIVEDDFILCRYKSKTKLARADGQEVASAAIWGVVSYVVQKASNR
jgi:hypothetical protein